MQIPLQLYAASVCTSMAIDIKFSGCLVFTAKQITKIALRNVSNAYVCVKLLLITAW